MPPKHIVVVPKHSREPKPSPAQPCVPQYHILIIAWSALVILYGEPGRSPSCGWCSAG